MTDKIVEKEIELGQDILESAGMLPEEKPVGPLHHGLPLDRTPER